MRALIYTFCFLGVLATPSQLQAQDTTAQQVRIVPNPMSQRTTIFFDSNRANSTLYVFNQMGMLVRQVDHIQGDHYVFKRKGLPAGIYSFYLEHTNGEVYRGKIAIVNK